MPDILKMPENTQKKIEIFIKKYWTVLLGLTILIALFVLKTEYRPPDSGRDSIPKSAQDELVIKKTGAGQKNGQSFETVRKDEKDSPDCSNQEFKARLPNSENAALKARLFEFESDNEALKRELIEISEKHEDLLKKIGNADLAVSEICSVSVPETRLDEKKILDAICNKAGQLALSGPAIAGAFASLAEKYEKDPVRKAEYLMMADSFKKDLAGLVRYTKGPSDAPVKKCRILAVNDELKTAAIDAGYMNGLRNGISLYAPGNVRLKIILCRPYLAAALVTEGSFSRIASGMEISLTRADK